MSKRVYEPTDWYWNLEGGSIWASARGVVVDATDQGYLEWLADTGFPPPGGSIVPMKNLYDEILVPRAPISASAFAKAFPAVVA